MARDLGDCSRCTRQVYDASDLTGAVHSNQSTEVDVTISGTSWGWSCPLTWRCMDAGFAELFYGFQFTSEPHFV